MSEYCLFLLSLWLNGHFTACLDIVICGKIFLGASVIRTTRILQREIVGACQVPPSESRQDTSCATSGGVVAFGASPAGIADKRIANFAFTSARACPSVLGSTVMQEVGPWTYVNRGGSLYAHVKNNEPRYAATGLLEETSSSMPVCYRVVLQWHSCHLV